MDTPPYPIPQNLGELLSLTDATVLTKRSTNELLQAAIDKHLRLVVGAPVGLTIKLLNEASQIVEDPALLRQPNLLVLKPEHCFGLFLSKEVSIRSFAQGISYVPGGLATERIPRLCADVIEPVNMDRSNYEPADPIEIDGTLFATVQPRAASFHRFTSINMPTAWCCVREDSISEVLFTLDKVFVFEHDLYRAKSQIGTSKQNLEKTNRTQQEKAKPVHQNAVNNERKRQEVINLAVYCKIKYPARCKTNRDWAAAIEQKAIEYYETKGAPPLAGRTIERLLGEQKTLIQSLVDKGEIKMPGEVNSQAENSKSPE